MSVPLGGFTDAYHQKCLGRKQIEWAYDKWCLGYSLKEIGEALCVSHTTLHRAFKGKGGKRRKKLEYPK